MTTAGWRQGGLPPTAVPPAAPSNRPLEFPVKTTPLLMISACMLLPALAREASKGISPSDLTSIHAAHEAWKHEFRQVDGVWQARNPGQQWTTTFDRRRFFAKPQNADWSWGLELHSYGFPSDPQTITDTAEIKAQGQRLSYHWHGGLEEWFVNDGRGLEHGFIVPERPDGARQGEPLFFTLSTVGGLRPTIAKDALTVHFRDHAGAPVLSYSGLKVWDADGTILESRFERANDGQFSIAVDEAGACYSITIDLIARQDNRKASNVGAFDRFGYSVAVSSDKAVVGANQEDSAATGMNGDQENNKYVDSVAACLFERIQDGWLQQACLKSNLHYYYGQFGNSIAASEGWVVVCHVFETSSTTRVNNPALVGSLASAGAPHVFAILSLSSDTVGDGMSDFGIQHGRAWIRLDGGTAGSGQYQFPERPQGGAVCGSARAGHQQRHAADRQGPGDWEIQTHHGLEEIDRPELVLRFSRTPRLTRLHHAPG